MPIGKTVAPTTDNVAHAGWLRLPGKVLFPRDHRRTARRLINCRRCDDGSGAIKAFAIVPMAENTPPIFAKFILVFDLSPDVDEAAFFIDIGGLRITKGASPLLSASVPGSRITLTFPTSTSAKCRDRGPYIRPFDFNSSAKFSSWKMPPVYKSKMRNLIWLIDQGCHPARSHINVGTQLSPSGPYLPISNPNQSDGNKGEHNRSDGNDFRIVDTNKLDSAMASNETLDEKGERLLFAPASRYWLHTGIGISEKMRNFRVQQAGMLRLAR